MIARFVLARFPAPSCGPVRSARVARGPARSPRAPLHMRRIVYNIRITREYEVNARGPRLVPDVYGMRSALHRVSDALGCRFYNHIVRFRVCRARPALMLALTAPDHSYWISALMTLLQEVKTPLNRPHHAESTLIPGRFHFIDDVRFHSILPFYQAIHLDICAKWCYSLFLLRDCLDLKLISFTPLKIRTKYHGERTLLKQQGNNYLFNL